MTFFICFDVPYLQIYKKNNIAKQSMKLYIALTYLLTKSTNCHCLLMTLSFLKNTQNAVWSLLFMT